MGARTIEEWGRVREWDKWTTRSLKYRFSNSIRHRFPHAGCTHDAPCRECEDLTKYMVEQVRREHEKWLHDKLEAMLDVTCGMAHPGSD